MEQISQFEKIDIKSPEIIDALTISPIYYQKVCEVNAREATDGEKIDTIMKSGFKETDNIAKKGDWIITNPSEEQYIISKDKFLEKYISTNKEGRYHAVGYVHAIKNPKGKPIEIIAPWGSIQKGDENCRIVDSCNKNGDAMEGDPYIVEGKAFFETYAKI